MAVSPYKDIDRAKQYRKMAKDVQDQEAAREFRETAARLEKRAAKNSKSVGKKRRKKRGTSIGAPTR